MIEVRVAIGAFKMFSNTLSFFLQSHSIPLFFSLNCVEFHLLKCKCEQLFGVAFECVRDDD